MVNKNNQMRPIHPGEILKDELDYLGLSARQFAAQLHIPVNRVTQIINGQRGITADTALRLAIYFGTTPDFWMNLQSVYEIKMTQKENGKRIQAEVKRRIDCQ